TVDPGGWVAHLSGERRIVEQSIPTARGPEHRWVAAEYQAEYEAAFGIDRDAREQADLPVDPVEARRSILCRFLGQTGPVTLSAIRARYAFEPAWLQGELERLIEARQLVHGQFTPRRDGNALAEPEYVDRRTLERIHRRTLHILRHEVKPVPFSVYADFLARWQHVHPETRLSGEGALSRVLQQLRAFPVAGVVWERDVLSLRISGYRPSELDALCRSGEVVWVGSGGTDPRRGRVRFLFRSEGSVYLEAAPSGDDLAAFSDEAQRVYALLKSEGALFYADICAASGLTQEAVDRALVELFMAGLVTNDSLAAMRKLFEQGSPRSVERKPYSSLEEELVRRRKRLDPKTEQRAGRPSPARYKSAKRRVRARLASRGVQRANLEPRADDLPDSRWDGRWTAVHRFGVLGKAVTVEEQVTRQTRQLLARYGVVTYACLADETGSWEWPLISQQLQRLEMRGEVRRGYFVQGLSGLQFSLPDVVEQLRERRDSVAADTGIEGPDLVVMNACDPANLYGPARDDAVPEGSDAPPDPEVQSAPVAPSAGEPLTFARVPSTWLVQHRGLPVLVAGNRGTHLTVAPGTDDSLVQRALRALLTHLGGFESRVAVERWNGEPVLDTAGRALLETVGFYRRYPGMIWERRP
ncbi:MAG: hypothetical protein JXA89_26250, partial [Anaerolineae bacterium]|nr:hypothetical protein [Anaerolineae bacterium]